ncbi:MAG: ISL3 family transposase [Oscillospiraceae bacterium]|nr:ISL3 family transposase [Oscillospiraceae bacterium]
MSGMKSIELGAYYPECLKIERVDETDEEVMITLKSMKRSHICPDCGQEARVYHGTYQRTVQDLPILHKNVKLKIKAYEYDCGNPVCETATFVEDYDGFVGRSERMTRRCEDFVRALAFETNCEGAAMICKLLGIKISGDTIIRMLRKLADQAVAPMGDAIGVDDFAYRKGKRYCTVICDKATHRPIDVLEGRDGRTLKEWLAKNKQVKIVTRDRAGAYASAISEILPCAMQVADRFHLHQNLLDAIKEALRCELPDKIAIPNGPETHQNEPAQNELVQLKKNG